MCCGAVAVGAGVCAAVQLLLVEKPGGCFAASKQQCRSRPELSSLVCLCVMLLLRIAAGCNRLCVRVLLLHTLQHAASSVDGCLVVIKWFWCNNNPINCRSVYGKAGLW